MIFLDYVPKKEKIQHVHALLQLLSVMEHDVRFEEILKDEDEGGIENMCDVLDRVENRGRAEGRAEGQMDATKLMNYLWINGRGDEAIKASENESILNKLLAEFRGGRMAVE